MHRDVKPANIVLCDAARRLRLIDLGAAADLRGGTNYKPAETILDPCYCPPEEVRPATACVCACVRPACCLPGLLLTASHPKLLHPARAPALPSDFSPTPLLLLLLPPLPPLLLQYVLPTDAPHLAEQGVAAARALSSALLWQQHRPDCFDSYSAGIVLMQLRCGWVGQWGAPWGGGKIAPVWLSGAVILQPSYRRV